MLTELSLGMGDQLHAQFPPYSSFFGNLWQSLRIGYQKPRYFNCILLQFNCQSQVEKIYISIYYI